MAIVVALGFVLFAGGGLVAGLMIWREPGVRGVAGADRSASVVASMRLASGRLDESTRRAMVGPATMVLPDEPYALDPEPKHLDGVIDVIFLANAPVHADYDGRQDWLATVALVQLSPQLDRGADLEQAGRRAVWQLSRLFFGHHPTRISTLSFADRAVDGHSGMEFTAEVHYRISGLASRYDRVVVRMVRADDGSLIAALSSVPDDASQQVADLATRSLDSLELR